MQLMGYQYPRLPSQSVAYPLVENELSHMSIDSTQHVIEDEDVSIAVYCSSEGHTSLLAARQVDSSLACI